MLPSRDRIPHIKNLSSIFLGSPVEAQKAWSELRQTLIFKFLSPDELKIIPQLIPRLAELTKGETALDPQLQLIEKLFNVQQIKTKKIQQNFLSILKDYPSDITPPLLLKGAALWKLYPKKCLVRKMSDLDILIPHPLRVQLVDHFKRCGWDLEYNYRYQKFNWNHAFAFRTPRGISVDLHWYIFKEDMSPDTNHCFFEDSTTHFEEGISYRLPSPEHLFYHLVLHGCRANSGSGIQWILDSLVILSNTPNFNWEKVTALAQKANLQKSLLSSIEILNRLDVPIPIEITEKLSKHRPSRYEQLQFNLSQIPPVDFSTLGFFAVVKRYIDFYFLWHHRFVMQKKWLSPFDFIRYYASSPTNIGAFKKMIGFANRWLRHRLNLKQTKPAIFNRSF